jgi:predicted nucleotidyltransferase
MTELLGRLRKELGTLPKVRLAVVFGSVARGEDREGSDLDLLVAFRRDGSRARAEVRERLEGAAARRVQLVGLDQAGRSPLLLADVLRDGRVLVDRDAEWQQLKGRESSIQRRAREDDRRLDAAAWAALEHLEM